MITPLIIILIIVFALILYFANNKKIDKETFAILAINKMFKIAGHYDMNYQKAQDIDKFYLKYSMTKAQRDKWKDWFILEVMDNFDYTYERAEKEFQLFDFNLGLTQSVNEETDDLN